MTKDRRLSVRMIAEETGLYKNAVHTILTEHLHMRKICAILVPKNLSVEQKANRLEICQDLLRRLEIEPNFLHKVITGAESWVFDYDPKTKRQSEERHTKSSPRPKRARMSRSRVKTMISVFLTAVALRTKNLYLQGRQLITPSTKMSWNNFKNGSSKSEGTLQTIGCCNTITCQLTLRFQFENFWRIKTLLVLPHPPYSPDLAPCDFYLFHKLKSKLKGHHFGTMENIQKIVTNELNTLMENDFQYCYDQWKKRWNHCVTSQGPYFEGDNL